MQPEAELSDKEWRQMRRRMPKLDFEPVPETPALLPRSLYGEIDQEEEEQVEKHEEIRDSAHLWSNASSNHHKSPKNRSVTIASDIKPDDAVQKQFSNTTQKDNGELPSISMAVSPLIASRYLPREQKREAENKDGVDNEEIAAIGVQMAAAQEAIRRSAMRAFIELKANKARAEALERMKLSAAHTNDIKMLQSKVEELKEQVAQAKAHHEQRDLLLDRYSEFTAKQSRLNNQRWRGERSLAACFHAWGRIARQEGAQQNALRRVLAQSRKYQQLASFRHWKESVHGVLVHKQLQDQRDRYEHRIVEMAEEYRLKIEQLQQEVSDARCQVAESQKCQQKLEEDLRLIFLRGVSAMNIEALSVFGSSHKQIRKLGEQERLIRQHTADGNQGSEAIKSTSKAVIAPEVISPPKDSSPKASLRAIVPIAVEVSDTVNSTQPDSRVAVVRPGCLQAPPYINRAVNGWARDNNTSGLRSAEMIRQHELYPPVGRQLARRSASESYRPSSAPSPTKTRSILQQNTKYQVEMQCMRSTVAASAAKASGGVCTRPGSVTRSPLSSARSRRS